MWSAHVTSSNVSLCPAQMICKDATSVFQPKSFAEFFAFQATWAHLSVCQATFAQGVLFLTNGWHFGEHEYLLRKYETLEAGPTVNTRQQSLLCNSISWLPPLPVTNKLASLPDDKFTPLSLCCSGCMMVKPGCVHTPSPLSSCYWHLLCCSPTTAPEANSSRPAAMHLKHLLNIQMVPNIFEFITKVSVLYVSCRGSNGSWLHATKIFHMITICRVWL